MASTAARTAASIPRFSSIGLAPAATFFIPRRTRARARTVAVVVPSPATSLVLVATSRASWAPMFSHGSSSSISLAMVTPSLVMVGAPHFLSRTTLRPFGPSVIETASASLLTPASRARLASSSYFNTLAAIGPPVLLLDHCVDVTGLQDDVLVALVLVLVAAVLAVDDPVPDLDAHRYQVSILVAPGPDGDHFALRGLFLRG